MSFPQEYCQVTESLLVYENAFLNEFVSSPAIKLAHHAPPRFGHSADVTLLVLGSKEDQHDYLRGLLSASIVIFVFFVVWVGMLIYCKIRGPRLYGWLSGSRLPMPPHPLLCGENTNDLCLFENDDQDDLIETIGQRQEMLGTTTAIAMDSEENIEACSGNSPEIDKTNDSCLFEEDDQDGRNKKIGQQLLTPTTAIAMTSEENSEASSCKTQDVDDTFVSWITMYQAQRRQNRRMKWLVSMAAIGIIMADMLMVIQGVPGLRVAVDSARASQATAVDTLEVAVRVSSQLVEFLERATSAVFELPGEINGLCPKMRDELCKKLDQGENCTLDEILAYERLGFEWSLEQFTNKHTVILSQVEEVRDFVIRILGILLSSGDALKEATLLFRLLAVSSMLLVCLCFGVLISLNWKLPTRVRKWQYRYFFPVFVLLVAFSFILVIAFIVSSTLSGDFCYGSPDDKLMLILQESVPSLHPLGSEIAQYVLSRCRVAPRSELQEYLVEGSNLVRDLGRAFLNTTSGFEEACGELNTTAWTTTAMQTSELLCNVSSSVAELQALFKCATWYPIYKMAVYETICDSVAAFSWVAFTQFFVVYLAMILVTCRVSIYQGIEIASTLDVPAPSRDSECHVGGDSGESESTIRSRTMREENDENSVPELSRTCDETRTRSAASTSGVTDNPYPTPIDVVVA